MIKVYKENNSIFKIEEILSKEKPNSILLITGNSSYEKSGAKDSIEPQLSNYNIIYLSGFSMYPPIQNIQEAIDIIKKKEIDFIIAIGGGTVMDIAKASSILYSEQGPLEDYIKGEKKPQGNNIKRLLIPTTAGTGAEITPYSSIYIDLKKFSLAHPSMTPDYVILAPELTYSLNPRITAQTGYDALAQAIEGFWSAKATEESKDCSKKAIPLILDNLCEAVNKPSHKNRAEMLLGAHLAGRSIAIAKTTTAHALSHPIMTRYNIPHGHAVSLTLPYFFPIIENATEENIHDDLNLRYVKNTFEELLSLLKVKNGEEAKKMLFTLADEINLERKLSDFGVTEEHLGSIVQDSGLNPKAGNTPVKITPKMKLDILKKIIK